MGLLRGCGLQRGSGIALGRRGAACDRHSDTRRHAIVLPGPDGPVIEQIVDVTCDVATRQRWAWRDDHRDHADTELDPIASRC